MAVDQECCGRFGARRRDRFAARLACRRRRRLPAGLVDSGTTSWASRRTLYAESTAWGPVLQTTALVHEAFVRLAPAGDVAWEIDGTS